MNRVPAYLIGLGQDLEQPFSDPDGVAVIAKLIEDDDEFIAPKPRSGRHTRDGVGPSSLQFESLGNFDDQQVADLVPKAVIDDLETVKIQKQDGKFSVRISTA